MVQRKVSIGDVAAQAGVAPSTVSRILNGFTKSASPATIARVHSVATELGYAPAYAARSLRTRESRLVALLIPDIRNSSYAAIADSIELALTKANMTLLLCNTREDPALQDTFLEEMRSHRVAACILLGVIDSPGLERALKSYTPLIFVNRRCPRGPAPFIGIDDFASGEAVGEHFYQRGYRSVAVIHGLLHSSSSRDRMLGFRARLADHGVTIPDDNLVPSNWTMSGGYAAAAQLLAKTDRPDAIFCTSEQIAYGALRCCREAGVRIPDDLAVFGFDDNPLNDWLVPWLSTVRIPHEEYGTAVTRTLGIVTSGQPDATPPETLLPFSLVIRQTA